MRRKEKQRAWNTEDLESFVPCRRKCPRTYLICCFRKDFWKIPQTGGGGDQNPKRLIALEVNMHITYFRIDLSV